MAIIRYRAMSRIKQYYDNAPRKHPSLSKEQALAIIRRLRDEMKQLDYGIPVGCHIVSPSWLSEWNQNHWTDVSSTNTRWHYALIKKSQAIICDAEHSDNMSDEAARPSGDIRSSIASILELQKTINNNEKS